MGLCASSPLCAADNPYANALVGIERRTLTELLTVPICRTTRVGRAVFDDGVPRCRTTDGLERAACVYTPPSAAS